jgi:hypothetical protein
VWGVGPAFQFPTASDEELGTGKWSAGPGFVVFLSDRPLHLTTGFLILNLWSFAGEADRANVNAMTLQPFINYNLPQGWYPSRPTGKPIMIIAGPYPSAVASGAYSRSVTRRSTPI